MNNDIYAEWLVKRKKSPLTVPFYIGIVLLFLIGFYASVISPFGFVALLAAAAAAYFGSARLHVEYEYVFVTNELAIDRILSQRTRKRMKKLDIQKIEKMAYDDIIKNELKVMDTAACALCKQNKIPIIVFDFKAKGSLEKIMDGEAVGTYVS